MREPRLTARSGTTLALAVAAAFAAPAVANPTGPVVTNGSAALSRPAPNVLQIVNTPGAILNWQSFSIGAGELTRFQQQSAASAVLNRVTGADPSSILGTLSSNGRVFLVNPHGIVFGAGSRIDTAGFVASTLNISDQDFLAGRLKFEGGGHGLLKNEGAIRSSGDIFLVGPRIENAGAIHSDAGSVVLAAGRSVSITSPDAHGVRFTLQAPEDSAVNLGAISAANAAALFAGTLRHSGEIRAVDVRTDAAGKVVLAAQKDALVEGGATIHADSIAGKGGSVRITGGRVGVLDTASVSARGATGGGEILVGGDYQGANPDVRNAAMAHVAPGATVDASATASGDGGRVIVWADDTARVHGSVFAQGGPQGGAGGFIETSGKRFLDVSGINVSAAGQTPGTWLLDPYNIEVVAGAGTVNNGGAPAFTPSGDNSQVGADLITGQLNAGTSVTLNTAGVGTQDGDITISAPIVKTATSASSLTLLADNNIAVNANITLPAGAAAMFNATAGGSFTVNNATVLAETLNVIAASIGRSGAQANDLVYGRPPSSTFGTLFLQTTAGAVGSPAEPVRFLNAGDASGRKWGVNTSAAGAAGDVNVRYTGQGMTFDGSSGVVTHAGTTQTVRLEHTGTGTIGIYNDITSNDDWVIDSAGDYGFAGATLFANSVNATFGGSTGRLGVYPLLPAFDTSAINGNITLTARDIDGTGCGGSQVGVGVKPGTGLVSATATAPNAGCGGSIQLMHFGGDLLTSRYTLNFSNAAVPGNYMRLKAADGHLIVDSTAGFNASLNNKATLLQTLTAGKDILFQGGTVQGGQVEVRSARNIDNLAPGTDGFIQTNALGGPHWMLVAGGGIGLTNPVEGKADWVGSAATSAAGAAGNINIKFTGGSPRFGEIRTNAGSTQNIDIQSTVGLIFSTGQPGYGGVLGGGSSSVTANDQYTINAAGSVFFDNFDNSFTANTITMTSGGGIVHGVSGGGDMMATTGLLTLNANGGSIGGAANYARLRGAGPQLLYALNDVYVDAGANPLTLAGISTGPGAGTIGLRTTAANDLTLGGTTNINDALALTIGGNIIFPAAANFTTSGGLALNSPTQIAATASVNVTGGTLTATQPVTNAGMLSTGIGGATTLAAAFHNTGTLDVNAGTLNLAGGGTSTGSFDAAPGTTINFSGGVHGLGDGSTLTGGGTIGYTGGTLNLNGGGAGTTVAAGTTLAATGQTFGGTGKLVNQGTFNFASSTVSGDVDNQGTLNASGASAINGALDLTSGTLNLVAGGTLTKGGAASDWIGGTLTGAGAYTGGLTFTGGGARVLNGPTLNVPSVLLPSGSLDVQGGALNLSGASQIAAGASLSLTGGTFSASGTLLNNGTLTKATGGVTSIAALLTNNGDLNLNAGELSVAGGLAQAGGNVSIGSGATLRFPSGTSSTWTGGTLTQAALDSTVLLDNATLTLDSAITNAGTWQTQFTANLAGTGTLTNTGKLNLFANFLSGTPAVVSANLVNQGAIETRDTIQINGAFSNASGATLLHNDAAVTVANGFTNAGTIQLFSDLAELPPSFTVTSGTLTNTGSIVTTGSVNQDQPLAAQVNNQGTLAATVGRLVIDKAGAAHVNTGAINAAGADVLFQQSGGGTLTHAGGTITASPGRSFTVTGGPMDWQGGTLAGTGAYAYAGGLTFTGGGARVLNGPALNLGASTLAGGSLAVQAGALNFAGTATIASGATLQAAGGTISATSVDIAAGGTLSGIGTVTGAVVNNGTVTVGASPGTLIVNGDYTQGAAGVLNMELGGTTQGVNYDLLQVTGTANLGGTLNVTLFGGFTGTLGDQFDLIAYANRAGDFATRNLPAGHTYTPSLNPTFYRLTIDTPAVVAPPLAEVANPIPIKVVLANNLRVLNDSFLVRVEEEDRPAEKDYSMALSCR